MTKNEEAVGALRQHGNRSVAADALGIPLTTLNNRLRSAKLEGLIAEEELDTLKGVGKTPAVPVEDLEKAVRAYRDEKSKSGAARALGLSATTFKHRLDLAKASGLFDQNEDIDIQADKATDFTYSLDRVKAENKKLKEKLDDIVKNNLTDEQIQKEIIGLKNAPYTVPNWVVTPNPKKRHTGVPSLLLSDWHWGEVVDPSQINYTNSFDTKIAKERVQLLVKNSFDLLFNHLSDTDYPGIILPCGGDFFSGDIHDELANTNENPTIKSFPELFGVMQWMIDQYLERFGKVFIPWVAGNHGRITKKPQHKNRNYTNFDWLLGSMLAQIYEDNDNVKFLIPNGSDAYYKAYGWRYILSHGDQFRGGDGIIGALGPIIRGDHRKRSRNNQIDMEYDTLLIGHWHQYIPMRRVIVNSSLKGYDEYAYDSNFPFEPPSQALWLTHPEKGPNTHMAVMLNTDKKQQTKEWVSWTK